MTLSASHSIIRISWVLFAGFSIALSARADRAPDPSLENEAWAQAVVEIEVPITRRVDGYLRHFIERCSATVVSPGPNPRLVSAWHCFEGYDELAAPAIARTDTGTISLELLASGGSMLEDWAVLRGTDKWTPSAWMPISRTEAKAGKRISAVGFARPPAKAPTNFTERAVLIDPDCRVTHDESLPVASNCVVQQGASGGAVVGRTASGGMRVFGIISAGDSQSVSYFFPTASLPSLLSP